MSRLLDSGKGQGALSSSVLIQSQTSSDAIWAAARSKLVQQAVIFANLSVTEAGDNLTATSKAKVQTNLTAVEGVDTLAAATKAKVLAQFTASDLDSLSANSKARVSTALSLIETDALVTTGKVRVGATLFAIDADTFISTGKVRVSTTSSLTDTDTFAATGKLRDWGRLSVTDTDGISAQTKATDHAIFIGGEVADACLVIGTVKSHATGNFTETDGLVAKATISNKGQLNWIEANDTLTAADFELNSARLSVVETDTCTAIGAVRVTAKVNLSDADDHLFYTRMYYPTYIYETLGP